MEKKNSKKLTQNKTFIAIGIAVLVLLSGSMLYRFQQSYQEKVHQRIAAQFIQHMVQASEGSNLFLLYPFTESLFEWDQLLVFPPYSSTQKMNTKIGYEWEHDNQWDFDLLFSKRKSFIQENDSIVLFVFLKNGKVQFYADVPQTIFPVDGSEISQYSPESAVFTKSSDNAAHPMFTHMQEKSLVMECQYLEFIPQLSGSLKTSCVVKKISGYSEHSLVVLDSFENSYVIRIFKVPGDLKSDFRGATFEKVFETSESVDSSVQERIWLIDGDNRTMFRTIAGRVVRVGIFTRDKNTYVFKWKM